MLACRSAGEAAAGFLSSWVVAPNPLASGCAWLPGPRGGLLHFACHCCFIFSCNPAQTKNDSNAQLLQVRGLASLCGGTNAAPLQQHDTIPNSLHLPTANHKATHSMHSITFHVSQFWKLRKCLRGVQSNPPLGQPTWGSVSTMKTCTMEGNGLLQTD